MRLDKVATPLKLLIPFYFFTFIPCASVCVRACVPAGVCVCYSVFICSNWKKIQIQIVNFLKFFSNRSHVKWMQRQANQWKINQTTNRSTTCTKLGYSLPAHRNTLFTLEQQEICLYVSRFQKFKLNLAIIGWKMRITRIQALNKNIDFNMDFFSLSLKFEPKLIISQFDQQTNVAKSFIRKQ